MPNIIITTKPAGSLVRLASQGDVAGATEGQVADTVGPGFVAASAFGVGRSFSETVPSGVNTTIPVDRDFRGSGEEFFNAGLQALVFPELAMYRVTVRAFFPANPGSFRLIGVAFDIGGVVSFQEMMSVPAVVGGATQLTAVMDLVPAVAPLTARAFVRHDAGGDVLVSSGQLGLQLLGPVAVTL